MRDVRSISFAVIMVLACASTGCPDEDGDNDHGDVLDAGMLDSGLNTPRDSATNTAETSTAMRDTTNSACHSWTLPAAPMCGGTHCLQNFEQITASVKPGAACGGEKNLQTLCSLKGPDAVGQCSLINVTNRSNILSCSEKALGSDVTPACLNCYMKSADCAFEQCIVDCINGTNTVRCDNCRLNKGCATIFYDCAGLTIPPG
jgi:hypothetical protein